MMAPRNWQSPHFPKDEPAPANRASASSPAVAPPPASPSPVAAAQPASAPPPAAAAPAPEPVPAPKHDVSAHALVHGLASPNPKHVALPGEEEEWEQYHRQCMAELAPVGLTESCYAEMIAADQFRMRRFYAMERAHSDRAVRERPEGVSPAEAMVDAFFDQKKGGKQIALYAHRIYLTLAKNVAALNQLQNARKARAEAARESAIFLTQLAESKGQTYDPAPDFPPGEDFGGFVYSASEIKREITRRMRLMVAQLAAGAAPLPAGGPARKS